MKILYIIIPCYNEEEVLPTTAERLRDKLVYLIKKGCIALNSRITFVNDGSTDNTWKIITDLHARDDLFSGINLSRNYGHQNAVLAGLMTVKDYADWAISMDADLQDDINVIDEMIEKAIGGVDIVYGVRSSRKSDAFFKRVAAEGFYKFMRIMGVNVVFNHADCRLMSKRAVNALEYFKEVNLFLRGIIPLIGYKNSVVYYERKERYAGASKYPLKKMISLAIEGISSFSVKPLKIITAFGLSAFLLSFAAFIYALVGKFIGGGYTSGWASVMCSIWMIGGLQILCLGVIGGYIGKIYNEVKCRPRYIIDSVLLSDPPPPPRLIRRFQSIPGSIRLYCQLSPRQIYIKKSNLWRCVNLVKGSVS
ncbi:MAG: glycosyltransferase family 2 protein [Treponema sp.]|jgi:glycosyltransferase involved in cell wall biosynthesis|nr:glycosyltransferase family 2 protein [Treponema sp.]